MNTCVWEGWTDRWHASEHLQAGGEVWRKAQVRAIWCLLFSRGSSPFGLTFQRWSIIYIGTYHNQLVILYMITLKTLSAKHIILCDILDTRLNRKIPTPWSFSPQGVWTLCRLNVIPLSAGLWENSDNLSTEVLRRATSSVLRDKEWWHTIKILPKPVDYPVYIYPKDPER